MSPQLALLLTAAVVVAALGPRLRRRMALSRAKHPSLTGHARIAKRVARLVPYYAYDEDHFFRSDAAPEEVVRQRRRAFAELAQELDDRAPRTLEQARTTIAAVSDLQFVDAYRVPFQYREVAQRYLHVGSFAAATHGVFVTDLDGNDAYDLAGSYGLNVFGYDFYKSCIEAGVARVRELGPVLGPYHPVVSDNVVRLRDISGLDEVSFHMSGTEAVMQAVRLARYHTRRSHVVQFAGAYHGWWDGVQPGVGNPRPTHDVYLLKDMDDATLRVLQERRDIACVLINPLQMLNPNAGASGDGSLIAGTTAVRATREAYRAWLLALRQICTARGIVLIFDEVFLGFRLARGGAQQYFGVCADMVTYGKTVGGGLPIGVLCGRRDLMKRFRDDHPADICFARGTFNAHPYVMGAMNEFLCRIESPEVRSIYEALDTVWDARARALNAELEARSLPVRVVNLASVWTIHYTEPSRYHWMFQYYLRTHGLALSWIGTGRLIFSHSYTDAEFVAVTQRFVDAAVAMRDGAWWWRGPRVTNRAIRRQVLGEIVRVRLGLREPWGPEAPREAAGPVLRDTTSRRETGR